MWSGQCGCAVRVKVEYLGPSNVAISIGVLKLQQVIELSSGQYVIVKVVTYTVIASVLLLLLDIRLSYTARNVVYTRTADKLANSRKISRLSLDWSNPYSSARPVRTQKLTRTLLTWTDRKLDCLNLKFSICAHANLLFSVSFSALIHHKKKLL